LVAETFRLGTSSVSGDRTIDVASSTSSAHLILVPKSPGTGRVYFDNNVSTLNLSVSGFLGTIYNTNYIYSRYNSPLNLATTNATGTNTAANDIYLTTGTPTGTGRYGNVQLNYTGTIAFGVPRNEPSTSYTIPTTTSTLVYTGSGSGTWTLPVLSTLAEGVTYFIKNTSASNLVVQRAGSDTIYTSTSATSTTLLPGESTMLVKTSNTVWVEFYH
jgi:hypothetical protein